MFVWIELSSEFMTFFQFEKLYKKFAMYMFLLQVQCNKNYTIRIIWFLQGSDSILGIVYQMFKNLFFP